MDGGVVIDVTKLDLTDTATWLEYSGVEVVDGRVTFYKAVDKDLRAGLRYIPTEYQIGSEVVATDWRPDKECGHGLHFSRSPHETLMYHSLPARFLEVTVPIDDLVVLGDKIIDDLVVLGDKIKAKSCRVVREVDIHCRPIESTAK